MATNDDSISIDQLRSFMAAVNADRQKDAASQVGIAQSTFNHHLRRVEAYFGGNLFEPGPGMRLTARGQLVAQGVSKTLAELVSTRALSQQRILRIGFIRVVRPILERVLRELGAACEGSFDVELFELSSEAQGRKMNVRELDVAICYSRAQLFISPDDVGQSLVALQPHCLVLPEHAWNKGKVDHAALSSLHYTYVPPLSSPKVFESGRQWLQTHCLAPRRQIECELATEIIAYAGAGRGYGFLPALWSTTNRDGVVFAPVPDFAPTSEVSAFWRRDLDEVLSPFLTGLESAAQQALVRYHRAVPGRRSATA